ncbi:hypothetical protein AAE478_010387 [Parahypoxylon ruwenzoriense]
MPDTERVYRPRGTAKNFVEALVEPSEPNVDIVAVHGLDPLNRHSHAKATWTADGKLWLRDFLPKQVPQARILLFGYNANVAFRSASAGVREQAENLLNQLERTRRALVHAKNDQTYEKILRSTFGIAFFGTPHKGGNHARIGNTVVVNKESSILGLPGSREKQIPLDANHSNICKFSSDNDPTYKQVADNVVEMIKEAIKAYDDRSLQSHIPPDDNMSNTSGEYNTTLQAGEANQCKTNGSANTIHQFGKGNRCFTDGYGNETIQIVLEPIDALGYAGRFWENYSMKR